MRNPPRHTLLAILLVSMSLTAPAAETDQTHATILLYHHVSTDTPRSTSVTPAVFESHLDYLADNDFRVLSLMEIATALQRRQPLPPRSVALTFDDAYESVLSEALPRLARRGWPFTVFVSTDAVDAGFAGFMDWDDLRRLESAGATIANHTGTHDHLVRRLPDESWSGWRGRIVDDIRSAEARLAAELDNPAPLFAWPFGEFDNELEVLAGELGYVAFGQQSGPAGPTSSLAALPRFPMATGFDDLDGLAEKLRTRPLPVSVISPPSRVLTIPARPPSLTLQIPDGPYRRDAMTCFVAGQQPAKLTWHEDIVTIVARKPLAPGRGKFNCTAPATAGGGVYYWYSHLWLQPKDDGSWYNE